jgi:hypothetical protein
MSKELKKEIITEINAIIKRDMKLSRTRKGIEIEVGRIYYRKMALL